MKPDPAPNRLLDLEELNRPEFAEPVAAMERLLGREPDAYLQPSKRWEYPWALSRLAAPPGSRVLDVGAGGSIFPLYLRQRGYDVSCVDYWMYPRLGRATGYRPHYVKADARSLPFSDGAFDAVFCISVIEHLPRAAIPSALADMRRVLRPGGTLILTTDFVDDADRTLYYETGGGQEVVDWGVFDAPRLERFLLGAPGLELEGELDLRADWPDVRERMVRFHGYAYTSVGVALRRTEPGPG